MRHMFDVDFKNIVHQFKANLSDEVASTMTVFGFEYRFNLHFNGPKAFQSVRLIERRTFIFESVRTQTSASAYSSKYYELRCLVRKFVLLKYTVFKPNQSMLIIRLQSPPQLKKCKWKLIRLQMKLKSSWKNLKPQSMLKAKNSKTTYKNSAKSVCHYQS